MKQTGTFYTSKNNANGTETKSPLPNIYIYFSQKGVRKLTTQTSKAGKFDFDLPLGDYNVTYSQGASHNVYNLAGGSEFSLTSSSKVNAFEQWAMTPVYLKPEENPLVIRLAELVKIATDAATEAKAIQDAMNNGSTGTGKWVKESLIANMMNVGDFGWGQNLIFRDRTNIQDANDIVTNGSYGIGAPKIEDNFPIDTGDAGLLVFGDYHNKIQIFNGTSREIYWRMNNANNTTSWTDWYPLYHGGNTTVDSNGNIKAASPIIKLFNDHIESNDSFKEKPIFEKMSTGVYKITNTLGLSQNGWTHNIPLNSNGRGYFRVRVEHLEDGCIVRVFKIKNVLNPDTFEIDVVDGDPVDIGKDQRWIDLRFHEEQEADDEELLTQLDNLDESAH